jgi:hypothetical protein
VANQPAKPRLCGFWAKPQPALKSCPNLKLAQFILEVTIMVYNSKLFACAALLFVFAACNHTSLPPQEPNNHWLQSVNDKALPALLLDTIYTDPNVPPYRFTISVVKGRFDLEGNRYKQRVEFLSTAEGYSNQRWIWDEFGTCSANGEKLMCESGYIQNYRFELVKQGNTLVTQQNFSDPALEGKYVFGR